MSMLTILYPLSPSYSGSTLLSLLLGNQNNVYCAGELFIFSKHPKRVDALEAGKCSCNEVKYLACTFWSKVDSLLKKNNNIGLNELNLESNKKDEFINHNTWLFNSIHELTGCNYIVDSSKVVSRFLQLREAGFNVVPIKLKRNPFGMVHSWVKRKFDWIDIAHYYPSFYKQLSLKVADRNSIKINYEDLVSHPEESIKYVLKKSNITLNKINLEWSAKTFHILKGNKMRFEKKATINQPSKAWKTEFSFYQKSIIWLLALPVNVDKYWFYFLWERLVVLITWKRY